MIKLITMQFIYSDESRRGKGVKGDVIRALTRLYTTEGELFAEYDPCAESFINMGPIKDIGKIY